MRSGAAPGGGVGFWPFGPPGGKALMVGSRMAIVPEAEGDRELGGASVSVTRSQPEQSGGGGRKAATRQALEKVDVDVNQQQPVNPKRGNPRA